ncbi:MAG: protein phosphatase 2C domain-containing protein [Kofleriaceae bacterium]
MDTISFKTASATVIGARHRRAERNGQDAACVRVEDGIAVAVVCDGCSSGAGSEVGARLGARWFAEAMVSALRTGDVRDRAVWDTARATVVKQLELLVTRGDQLVTGGDGIQLVKVDDVSPRSADGDGIQLVKVTDPSPRTHVAMIDAQLVRELTLFTIVATAITRDGAAVFAIGDGAYAVDGRVRVLGPFPDNEPPYIAYDLLGAPSTAHFATFDRPTRVLIATDGIDDLGCDVSIFGASAITAHPDALRRRLVQLARNDERIDWDERRVIRTPARLQDDLAIAIVEVL